MLSAAGVSLFPTGCLIPPPPTIAPVIGTNKYSKQEAKHFGLPEDLRELTMDFCVQIALKNNPNVLSKIAAINAAWARYYQSLSGYAPQVDVNGGYSGNSVIPRGPKPTVSTNGASLGANASLLLFNGLTREMNVIASQYDALQAEFLNADARRLLIQAVGAAFNQVQAAREEIRIQEENRRYQQGLLVQADAKFKAGTTALSDVLNFEIQLYDIEVNLIGARATEQVNRFALAQLMGLTTSDIPESALFPSIKMSTYVLSDVNIYLDAALRNRPDLKAYRQALKSAEYSLYAKYGEFTPTFTANTGTGLAETYSNATQDYSRQGNVSWGVNASWNVFNGFKTWNRIRESQAFLEQNNYAVATAWINVINEVRQAHQYYLQYQEQLSVNLKKLELVKQTRELVVEQYKAGTTEVVRVNEAQRDVVSAETQVANLMILIVNAKIRLDAAAGFAQ